MAKSAAKQRVRQARPGTGFFTKLLILLLLAALSAELYHLRGRVEQVEAEKVQLTAQVAQRQQENDALRRAVENGGSEEEMRKIARKELGMADPNDKIFYDTSN